MLIRIISSWATSYERGTFSFLISLGGVETDVSGGEDGPDGNVFSFVERDFSESLTASSGASNSRFLNGILKGDARNEQARPFLAEDDARGEL